MGHLLEMHPGTPLSGGKGMTQLELTIEAIRQMDDPCVCEQCQKWVPAGNLRPFNGSINDRAFGLANRSVDVPQTIWLCLDCLDDER